MFIHSKDKWKDRTKSRSICPHTSSLPRMAVLKSKMKVTVNQAWDCGPQVWSRSIGAAVQVNFYQFAICRL